MPRRTVWVAMSLFALAVSPAAAQPTGSEGAEVEMTTYQLVFVVTNAEFEEDESVNARMADHRVDRMKTASDQYLRNLIKDKVALIAGPLPDHDRIKQVAIVEADSADEAAAVFQHSPAVEAGRLELEIYPWWAAKGILARPKDPFDLRYAYLGLLERAENAPEFTEQELESMQRGHLENMQRMTESGALVIAGPVEGGGALRGIMIFRDRNVERIEKLVENDPAIQAGRLRLGLHRWQVPKRNWIRKDLQIEAALAE